MIRSPTSAALPQAADQVSDLGQLVEDLAQVSPGVADSDGDQRPDISVPVAQPGEVDSDGDGVPDMSALQSPASYPRLRRRTGG